MTDKPFSTDTAVGLPDITALAHILLDQCDMGVVVLDARGYVTIWNSWMEAQTGRPAASVIGQPLIELFPHLPQATLAALELVQTTGQPRVLSPILHPVWTPLSQRSRPFVRLFPLLAHAEETVGLVILIQDLAARMDHEEQLEERFRLLVQTVQDYAIFMLDPEGRMVSWNIGAERITGWQAGEAIGRHLALLYSEEDVARGLPAEALRTAREQGQFRAEGVRRRRDGTPFWADELLTALYDRTGAHRGFAVITRDVTERRRSQEALRLYAERLRILREIDQAIIAARSSQEIAQAAVNHIRALVPCQLAAVVLFEPARQQARLLAGDLGGLPLQPPDVALTPELLEEISLFRPGPVQYAADLATEEAVQALRDWLLRQGMRSVLGAPLVVGDQVLGAFVLASAQPSAFATEHLEIAREVADQLAVAIHHAQLDEAVERHAEELEQRVAERTAELQKANEQLKELDVFKSEFVSKVSHELRSPLTNIKMLLTLLEMGKPEKRSQYMASLHREADLSRALIDDLLYLSRMDLGRIQPKPEPVDLNRLIRTLVSDRAGLFAERGQLITFSPEPHLPPVQADPRMLTQVLSNLMSNAMNYTPRGGSITISTARRHIEAAEAAQKAVPPPGTWVSFSVSDTGPGIAPEEQAHLFERFFRGEAARQTGAAGTGLGLAICYEIVQRHGGHITVESELGQGTTFTVWLPAP